MNGEDKKEEKNPAEQNGNGKKPHSWRDWHERESCVSVNGVLTDLGAKIKISSKEMNTELGLNYPKEVWENFAEENKTKFLDNVTYIFTAHLPFLLKGNIRLEYNTGYPQVYSWANQCFMRFLPSYWYLYKGRRGTRVFPLLKTMLNSRAIFSQSEDVPPDFPVTSDKHVVIPFTFGKDSFLTYFLSKDLGLNPVLVYFNEPTEMYAAKHKLELIEKFKAETGEQVYYLENPFGKLREYGEGWFGWELALTSWSLLCLPFAYHHKAGYIIFSNEISCNDFFYDDDNFKVLADYEQSGQATEEMSLISQALSEGEVYTTTFLQGIYEVAVLTILKNRFPQAIKFLMSCWAETDHAADHRWCHNCSKCGRIYLFLCANGIDPADAGFERDLFKDSCRGLFSLFGQAAGTGYDSFGTNRDEQLFAFYLTYLRGYQGDLVKEFVKSPLFEEAQDRFQELLDRYFGLHQEFITPPQWKDKVDKIFSSVLTQARAEAVKLNNKI